MDITEKYRPRTFGELVGQEKAVKRLEHIGRDGYGGKSIWIAGPCLTCPKRMKRKRCHE